MSPGDRARAYPPASGQSLALAGVLAGARVFSNCPIPALPQSGYHDRDVEIVFIPQTGAAAKHSQNTEVAPPCGIALPPATGLRGQIAEDGRWAAIEEYPDQLQDRALSVRRVLPFAVALQGEVTLHAAAVSGASAVHAFVGASGAGKSTLAASLAGLGMQTLADDLLPCRMRDGAVAVPIDQNQSFLPLRAVYFLARRGDAEYVSRTQLSSADCLKRLLVHGFGEVGLKKAWAVQFALYECIARTIPAYDLLVPDCLPHLQDSARAVKALIARQASQATSFQTDT